MAWTTPHYTKGQVDKAGRQVVSGAVWTEDWLHSLDVINNWRSSHSFPLNAFKIVLKRRALSVDDNAVVAQRLKRLSSIEGKLRRQSTRLTQMQDIGGCRAVVSSVAKANDLANMYLDEERQAHKFVNISDYIDNPKTDGYRGIHLVYRYQSRSTKNDCYDDLLIEIQLRTRLQHAWATAVETATTFTRQALKWRGGSEDWKRFFALMGSALAIREEMPLVPGTPTRKVELKVELRQLVQRLNVRNVLIGWSAAVNSFLTRQDYPGAKLFLMELEMTPQVSLRVTPFGDGDRLRASELYLAAEKKLDGRDDGSQAVLVSVDSVDALKSAYPNYYVDTRAFVDAIKQAIS